MPELSDNKPRIVIVKNGCYRVYGNIPLREEIIISSELGIAQSWKQGKEYQLEPGRYSLCRCGKSKNPPFCDGTHKQIDFDGTETASKENPFKETNTITGPDLLLDDEKHLCAAARFCMKAGGIWDLVENSNNPEKKALAIQEAHECPAGRLVVKQKETGKPIEPELEPSISIVEDEFHNRPGPIWVKGGVAIVSADGTIYAKRNRVTLCRCGKSQNKPFCDGSHIQS
ncbi:MAG: CDGSH iron-sulfur domain-containing protein [Spirochaetales bacterium]|nr:CDGSH iron-sulfur domain-containing protein [Spirochaetales bacterium]